MDRDPGPPLPDAETRLAAPLAEGPPGHRDELRLWLRLLTCTTLIEGEVRSRLRARFDVTLPRFDLMAQLEKAPDGLTLGELSRRMMVSNGNITGLVERLVDSGHIVRVPHVTDRRIAYVKLTDAGRAAFAAMAREHADWIGGLFAGLPPSDARTLLRLLGQLKQSVRAASAQDAAARGGTA
jgi:DNA-binding MarR family transcriptional regulator